MFFDGQQPINLFDNDRTRTHKLNVQLNLWRMMSFFSFHSLDSIVVPKIDVAFVLNAAASNADSTFIMMKNTVNEIVKKYYGSQIR